MMKKYLPIYLLLAIFNIHSQEISTSLEKYDSCGFDKKSKQLAKLLMESTEQKRTSLTCNAKLTKAANKKAQMMAEAENISHNMFHISPNELLKNEGVSLPLFYRRIGNQVETILGGAKTAQDSFDYFMADSDYKVHIFGENDLTEEQDQIGIGYYEDKSKTHMYYWAIYITALMREEDNFNVKLDIKPAILKLEPIVKEKMQWPNGHVFGKPAANGTLYPTGKTRDQN